MALKGCFKEATQQKLSEIKSLGRSKDYKSRQEANGTLNTSAAEKPQWHKAHKAHKAHEAHNGHYSPTMGLEA
jgi:hypothetical protein